MKRTLSFCVAFLLYTLAVHAQSAEKITELIGTDKATYGQVAYLSATYQNKITETADYQQALEALQQDGVFADSVKADDIITLADTSKAIALATGIKGGLFYTLTHSARYAFRELKAKNILPQSTDPCMAVNGRVALHEGDQ